MKRFLRRCFSFVGRIAEKAASVIRRVVDRLITKTEETYEAAKKIVRRNRKLIVDTAKVLAKAAAMALAAYALAKAFGLVAIGFLGKWSWGMYAPNFFAIVAASYVLIKHLTAKFCTSLRRYKLFFVFNAG